MSGTVERPTRLTDLLPHLVLVVFALYIVLPPLWVLRTSFVPDALAYDARLLPSFTLENYRQLLSGGGFGVAYWDSVVAALGSTLLGLPFAAATGYAFARYGTAGRPGASSCWRRRCCRRSFSSCRSSRSSVPSTSPIR